MHTYQAVSLSIRLLFITLTSTVVFAEDFPAIYNSDTLLNAVPMSAQEAASTMQVPKGFRVSVFASEPDVQNPIAVCWDTSNRMWVAENYTYAERQQRFDLSLRDRVVVLEDADNDGHAEKRKVFTDNVQMLTSVEVGRGGVWLMCPPQLLFVPDTDGDDVADGPAQVILDGFTVAKDNYHNFANGLRWGPDGWLYGRCGHSCPGRIGVPGTPDELRIPIDGGIWRFHPDKMIFEVLCHGTVNPWGHDWDEHGELFFINTVIGHLWHVMPGAHFKESSGESTNSSVYERLDMIADHYHFDTKANWTESRDGKANDFGGGHAHVGMMIYQSKTWPETYRNKLFTLNMHGYRANVETLKRSGAGYVASHEPDFLFAKDPFFRGVEVSTGPDGNVYFVDWSDTGECHEHTGVHRTSGRIYKVSYGEARQASKLPKPACMSGQGELAALWSNYQKGNTTADSLRDMLRSPDEHVRVWAIRLLTDFWPLDTIVGPRADAVYPDDVATRSELVQMAKQDPSGLVLLTLASTLQRLAPEHRAELATALVQRSEYAEDRDLPSMVWYGLMPLGELDPDLLVQVASQCKWPSTLRWIARNLMSKLDSRPGPMNLLLAAGRKMPEAAQAELIRGMQQAVKGWRRADKPEQWDAFAKTSVVKTLPDAVRELDILFGDGRALQEIKQVVLDGRIDTPIRVRALESLIDADPDDLRSVCESVLDVRSLNTTAARGLSQFDDPAIAKQLIKNYRRFDGPDRPGILEILASRPSYAAVMLDHFSSKDNAIALSEITPYHARQILNLGDKALASRLSEVWGELRDSPEDQQKLVARLREQLIPAMIQQADLTRGRELYAKTCSQCHVLYGEGGKVGPDLTGSQRSSLDYLLENIVDPSAVVGKDFRMTNVLMTNGNVLSGLVMSDGEKTLVLQTPTEQRTIAKEDIEEIRPSTLSAMPAGLLETLTLDQTRDLIGYLMHPVQVPQSIVPK